MSLINWLKAKPTPRYYWCNTAAYGVESESQTPVPGSLGLLRFDNTRLSDALWEPFGASRFIVPKEMRIETREEVKPSPLTPLPVGEGDFAKTKSGEGWAHLAEQALARIQVGDLQKVVLAQRQTLISPTPIDPIRLFERLQAYFPDAHHFYYEPKPGVAFMGASPERLYKRTGFKLESEAQAGTRLRGLTAEEDQTLSRELLESPKDHHEHQLVVDNILSALNKICLDYGITEAKHITKLPNLQHLKTKVAGILENHITDQDILNALHPTAAVCGWPIDKAFETIRQLEDFDRGFYAGALGVVSEHESEFNVAIRSAVIEGCQLHVFAGAGLVTGSNAASEQQEIENKMAFWERLL